MDLTSTSKYILVSRLLCDDVLTLTVKPPVKLFSCNDYLESHVHEAISVLKSFQGGMPPLTLPNPILLNARAEFGAAPGRFGC